MAWGQYKGRSVGRVYHFLHQYCGQRLAERMGVSTDGKVTLHGKPFATYVWEHGDVPHFTFTAANSYYAGVQEDRKADVIKREALSEVLSLLPTNKGE